MSYHRPKLGATPLALKLDTEAAKKLIAATAADLDRCPEGERWNKSLERCIPVREAERVSPERECPEGTRYSKAMLEMGRDPCVPEVRATRHVDRSWKIRQPEGYEIAPALEPKGAFCMQPYLTYEVPCTTENTERYLFPINKYRAAQRRLQRLLDNPPAGLADPVVDNDTWAPKLRTITGVSTTPQALEKRGVGDADEDVAEDVVNWIFAIIHEIEAIYDASNVSPWLLHPVVADDKIGLKSRGLSTVQKKFLPSGTKNAGGIPVLPPSLWGLTPAEYSGKADEKQRAFLEGSREVVFRPTVDIAATLDYRTRKWPGFTSGERRRAKRKCHKRDEFRFLPTGKRSPNTDAIRRRHIVRWFAESGGVVAKVRGRTTIERSRSHPKGRCGSSDDHYAITAGTVIVWYKNYARYMASVPINKLISDAMRGYAAQLRYFLQTYQQDMSPEDTDQIVKAIKDAEREQADEFIQSSGQLASIINGLYGAIFTIVAGGLVQLLFAIGGTAIGGIFCPKIPFRRLIITKGCNPEYHSAPATVQLETAMELAPRGRKMFDPEKTDDGPKPSFWDKYKWWIIGGGTALAATAVAVPMLTKNDKAPRRRRRSRR